MAPSQAKACSPERLAIEETLFPARPPQQNNYLSLKFVCFVKSISLFKKTEFGLFFILRNPKFY